MSEKRTISKIEVMLTGDGSWCLLHADDDPRENKWIDPDEVAAIRAAVLPNGTHEFTADIPTPRLFLSDTVCVIRGQRYSLTRLHDEVQT